MEDGTAGSWKQFLNKKIKVIYDDFGTYPKKKEGVLTSFNDTHLFLKIGSSTQAISIVKTLRVEEVPEDE